MVVLLWGTRSGTRHSVNASHVLIELLQGGYCIASENTRASATTRSAIPS